MARIAGIDLPKNKRGEIALTYIYGIGRTTACNILDKAGIDRGIKVQDWTDAQETDAMWRIYSHPEKSLNDSAARVATTIGKIKMVLKEQNYVINRVNYLPQSNIEHISSLTVGELQQFFRDSSFCKRIEFQHEQEARIVVENESVKDDLLSIQIPTDFFDEYLLDPRLTSEQEAEIRSILEAEKVPSKKIKKSELYKFNIQTIQILN